MAGIFQGIIIGYNPISWLLRLLFFTLDSLIYSLSPMIYRLALKLTNMQILVNQEAVLNSIAEGVYSLLAIAMLFRFAFSLLTMLADPEKINDKQQGLGKIATNAIITLILIVAVPALFNGAAKLQDVLLSPDAPEKSIIGGIFSYNDEYSNTATTDLGTFMAREVFKIFVTKNPEATDAQSVAVVYDEVFTSPELDLGKLGSIMYKTYTTGSWLAGNPVTLYSIGYFIFASTAAGLYLLWIFLSFTIEVTHRSIKLFVLQLISPIAIISYIDPTSASKGIFKKWMDEVVKTYLSLFIRIAVLTVVGTIILNINWGAGIFLDEPFLVLFFFLGLFTFLKTGPKMIDTIFGITAKTKEEGFGKAILGGAIGGIAAGAVGGITSGISSARHGYGFAAGARTGGWESIKKGGKAGFSGKPNDIVKSFGSGLGATGKTYGYKTGAELMKEKLDYSTKMKAAKNIYDSYKTAYNNETAEDKYVNAKIDAYQADKFDLSKQVTGHPGTDMYTPFTDNEKTAYKKVIGNKAAYTKMFGTNYAKALVELETTKINNAVFQRQLREAELDARKDNAGAEDIARWKELDSKSYSFSKAHDDAKDTFDVIDKNPSNQNDHIKYETLVMGKKSN